jgi:transcriptional regulator with XRE-family HTH domain
MDLQHQGSSTTDGKTKRQRTTGKPNPVDSHVGNRLRVRRTLLGLSQEKVGEAMGLTFQQVQKYERGANRLGASRLFEFSHILDVPVDYFFAEMGKQAARTPTRAPGSGTKTNIVHERSGGDDPLLRRETLQLVRAYFKIRNPSVRNQVAGLIKALGR